MPCADPPSAVIAGPPGPAVGRPEDEPDPAIHAGTGTVPAAESWIAGSMPEHIVGTTALLRDARLVATMTLRKTIEVVTRLAERGVIRSYAIAGAVAALNYIQPTLTEDLDVLISIDGFERRASGLLLLGPIEKALAEMGYAERTDLGYEIEGWPVQFLPVGSPLDEEALERAVELDLAGPGERPLKVRSLSAEHVVAIALKLGRLKDLARVQAFLEQEAVDLGRLKDVLARHNLMAAWKEFCLKAAIENPLQRP